MREESRKCELCGGAVRRAAYIPLNGGLIVCGSCCREWEASAELKTIEEGVVAGGDSSES